MAIDWKKFRLLHTEERLQLLQEALPKPLTKDLQSYTKRLMQIVTAFPLTEKEQEERLVEKSAYNFFVLLKEIIPQKDNEDDVEYTHRLRLVYENRSNDQMLYIHAPRKQGESQVEYQVRLLSLQYIEIWEIEKFI